MPGAGFSTSLRIAYWRGPAGSPSTMPYMCSCPAGTSFSAITPVPGLLVDVDQLAHARDLGVEQIVAQQDRERLVADRLARAQHRVPSPRASPWRTET